MDAGIISAIVGGISGLGGAVLTALVTALLGLKTYRKQKQVDRDEELRRERAKAYTAYLSAYAKTERWRGVEGREKEFADALLRYSSSYSAVLNIGSNRVFETIARFHNFVFLEDNSDWDFTRWRTEYKLRYAAVLLEIRNAIVEDYDISAEEIAGSLPWDIQWNISEKSHSEVPT
jgi:hypothetical protein